MGYTKFMKIYSPKINKQVTIILFTHNRHQFVERFIKFYANHPINIVIAASGNDDSIKIVNDICNKYKKIPVQLFAWAIEISAIEKILKTIREIDYDYICLCADDDYIIPDSIMEGVEFLDKNKDYVSATGYVFSIGRPRNSDGFFEKKMLCHPYNQLPLIQDDPMKRLRFHLNNYCANFYHIYRKKDLLEFFENGDVFGQSKSVAPADLELFLSFLVVLKGKTHLMNNLYMVRQGYNPIAESSVLLPLHSRILTSSFYETLNIYTNKLFPKNIYRKMLFLYYYACYVAKFSSHIALSNAFKDLPFKYVFFYFLLWVFKKKLHNSSNFINLYKPDQIKFFQTTKTFKEIYDLINKSYDEWYPIWSRT